MTALNLPQRLALVKFLTDALASLRKKELLPQSEAEMPPGARIPVMFGGKLAAWATMPQPSKKAAYVKDERALLAWAQKQYPGKVEPTAEVLVDDALIAFLAEHRPVSLKKGERVERAWLGDILGALAGQPGYYTTITGEKLFEVPGVEVPEPDPPAPRVNLTDDADAVIRGAWHAGDIPVAELLALPVAGEAA